MLKHRLWVVLVLVGAALTMMTLTRTTSKTPTVQAQAEDCLSRITITHQLPEDIATSDQASVNCFAWQSFIALNWLADPNNRGEADINVPASAFGNITPDSLTVWQTYRLPEDTFLPNAAPPPAWNTPDIVPSACNDMAVEQEDGTPALVFTSSSKFGEVVPEVLEADLNYLVDQRGHLVYYERRMNEVEFNYIVENNLYNAVQQQAFAENTGINLPNGTIEIKSAWRVLDGLPDEVQNRYFQVNAYVAIDGEGSCESHRLGLIGLHIVRKTERMQYMMWSTFEHVDNYPDPGSASMAPYTLFNPDCAGCLPNVPPPTPMPSTLTPVQVTREYPIPSDVQALNEAVHGVIKSTNPNSVWVNYQLANALWFQNATEPIGPAQQIPIDISSAGMASSGEQPVANISMETYHQANTCTFCHVNAGTAASITEHTCVAEATTYSADFSFFLRGAQCPP